MKNRIKEIRQSKGLTLYQLADKAHTTHSSIHKLENSQRKLSLDWMIRLSKALGCHPAELIEWDMPLKMGSERINTDPVLFSIIETIVDMAVADQGLADRREELIDTAYRVAQRHFKGGISPFNKDFMADLQREIYHVLTKKD